MDPGVAGRTSSWSSNLSRFTPVSGWGYRIPPWDPVPTKSEAGCAVVEIVLTTAFFCFQPLGYKFDFWFESLDLVVQQGYMLQPLAFLPNLGPTRVAPRVYRPVPLGTGLFVFG